MNYIASNAIFNLDHIRRMRPQNNNQIMFRGEKGQVWLDVKDMEKGETITPDTELSPNAYRSCLHQIGPVKNTKYKTQKRQNVLYVTRIQ